MHSVLLSSLNATAEDMRTAPRRPSQRVGVLILIVANVVVARFATIVPALLVTRAREKSQQGCEVSRCTTQQIQQQRDLCFRAHTD